MKEIFNGDIAYDVSAGLPEIDKVVRATWARRNGADPDDDQAWRQYLRDRAATENALLAADTAARLRDQVA